jgi:hypothetical protein
MNETPLERRHRRVKTIRARITAAAAALFIALFGGIAVQLASGHDPALAAKGTKSTSSAAATATSAAVTDDSQSSADGKSSNALTPVTTSQS